jgi:hypothetical protein
MQFVVRLSVVCLVTLSGVVLAAANRAAEQTLPTGCIGIDDSCQYFIQDGGTFFPSGPEFKLLREAAAMKAYKTDLEAQQAGWQKP